VLARRRSAFVYVVLAVGAFVSRVAIARVSEKSTPRLLTKRRKKYGAAWIRSGQHGEFFQNAMT